MRMQRERESDDVEEVEMLSAATGMKALLVAI
jgi:hypothetical protein